MSKILKLPDLSNQAVFLRDQEGQGQDKNFLQGQDKNLNILRTEKAFQVK